MKIAIFQAEIRDKNIDENLSYLKQKIKDIDNDVDLIILPEMFLTGFYFDTSLAKLNKDIGLSFMKTIAKEKDLAVEGSLFIEEDNHYYNRHYFVTKDNISYYDKKHLFCLSKEPDVITPGKQTTIVNYKGFNILPLTCYDLRFPLWSRNKIINNHFLYDIIVYVASWPNQRKDQWLKLLMARAIENQCYVIGVNRCGRDLNNVYYSGYSVIINPNGEICFSLFKDDDNIGCYSINIDEITTLRKSFNVSQDWD